MESLLDGVEEGLVTWKTIVRNFYPDLEEAVNAAQKELEQVKIEDEVTDEICEQCGRNMVIKYGPHGTLPGLSRYSRSAAIRSRTLEKTGVPCPLVRKPRLSSEKTKKGQTVLRLRCNNPECEFHVLAEAV